MSTSIQSAFDSNTPGQAWGTPGCPILPRSIRERMAGIEVPPELCSLLGRQLTFDELNADLLDQCNLSEFPAAGRDFVRQLVDGASALPLDAVVIPPDIPLNRFEQLPLSTRAKYAVETAYRVRDELEGLRAPLTARAMLGLRGIGIMICLELMCVIESASDIGGLRYSAVPVHDPLSAGNTTESIDTENPKGMLRLELAKLVEPLMTFSSWAQVETNADALGDALGEAISRSDEIGGWDELARVRLVDIAPPAPHPYGLIATWLEGFAEREKEVFRDRIAKKDGPTLQEIADRHGISRERVRQLEAKVRTRFDGFLQTVSAAPIRWRANSLKKAVGVAMPYRSVRDLLKVPPDTEDFGNILINIADLVATEGNWLVREGALEMDPTDKISSMADEYGRIDLQDAFSRLGGWGLDPSLHFEWLSRKSVIRNFNGQLVLWGKSVGDRILFALADLGRPATIREIMQHVGETTSAGSARNAIAEDRRVIRIDKSRYALKSWGHAEFTSIANSIREMLRSAGHPISVQEVITKISAAHQVAATSVQGYTYAPMFAVEDGYIRERTAEESFHYPQDALRRTVGVFVLGPRRVGLLRMVDEDMLRGSGRPLGLAAGSILEVAVNERVAFQDVDSDTVVVTFPESSFLGPNMGSVRVLAEKLGARLGDYLTIILDRTDLSVAVNLTRPQELQQDWKLVSRLTGNQSLEVLTDLGATLRCDESQVQAVLMSRGDTVVLSAIPQ